jgi:hypothetical protein
MYTVTFVSFYAFYCYLSKALAEQVRKKGVCAKIDDSNLFMKVIRLPVSGWMILGQGSIVFDKSGFSMLS